MRFTSFHASSSDWSLDQTLETLKERDGVVGVLFLGTTATEVAPWSDYDLLLVTSEGDDFAVECTTVDGRPTDVIFLRESALADMTQPGIAISAEATDVLGWLARARVAFSRSEIVDAAPERARALADRRRVARAECYLRWVEANFNLKKAERYASAPTALYRDALRLQMVNLLSEVSADFLAARGRPWAGEKDAVQYIQENDPGFLDLLLDTLAADTATQVANYARLVEQAFAPVGDLWPERTTSGGWFLDMGSPSERSRWEALLQSG